MFNLESHLLLVTTKADDPRYLGVLRWTLYVIATWSFAWTVYRAFLNVEIEPNEGWNAYFADAAMGKMPLYPSADQLITNNYPPLSFYIVGLVGRFIGDPVLAGRLLSLVAVVAIATAIALSVRRLGGSGVAARISGAFFVATMSRFFMPYVGMNEPQLLAEAIMAFGFLWFLIARSNDRGYVGPVLVMALAGFVKHNIIAMPADCFPLACPIPSPRSREVFLRCGDRHHSGYRNLLCLVRRKLLSEHLISQALFVEKGPSHFWRIRMGVCRFSRLPLQCLGSSS